MEKMESGNNILYSDLTQQDTEEVFNFFRDKSLHGVHRPSFYTVSSLIDLYGSISCAVRIDKELKAVSVNLPTLERTEIYCYVFAVKNDIQRRRVGQNLFLYGTRLFRSLGYNNVLLRVLKSNNAAYQFWRTMGFLEVPDRSDNTNDEFSEYCMEFML